MLFVPSLSNFVKIVHDSIVASSIVDFSNKRVKVKIKSEPLKRLTLSQFRVCWSTLQRPRSQCITAWCTCTSVSWQLHDHFPLVVAAYSIYGALLFLLIVSIDDLFFYFYTTLLWHFSHKNNTLAFVYTPKIIHRRHSQNIRRIFQNDSSVL